MQMPNSPRHSAPMSAQISLEAHTRSCNAEKPVQAPNVYARSWLKTSLSKSQHKVLDLLWLLEVHVSMTIISHLAHRRWPRSWGFLKITQKNHDTEGTVLALELWGPHAIPLRGWERRQERLLAISFKGFEREQCNTWFHKMDCHKNTGCQSSEHRLTSADSPDVGQWRWTAAS